jgi:hypothetical protein
LPSASAAECIICGSKKKSYNCNYKCKQIAMLVVCGLQTCCCLSCSFVRSFLFDSLLLSFCFSC